MWLLRNKFETKTGEVGASLIIERNIFDPARGAEKRLKVPDAWLSSDFETCHGLVKSELRKDFSKRDLFLHSKLNDSTNNENTTMTKYLLRAQCVGIFNIIYYRDDTIQILKKNPSDD